MRIRRQIVAHPRTSCAHPRLRVDIRMRLFAHICTPRGCASVLVCEPPRVAAVHVLCTPTLARTVRSCQLRWSAPVAICDSSCTLKQVRVCSTLDDFEPFAETRPARAMVGVFQTDYHDRAWCGFVALKH